MSEMEPDSFRIGEKVIGPPGFAYVIAEAGVNHDGDPAVARDLVAAAAQAGADAVKFQVFSADRLVTRAAPTAGYQRVTDQSETQYDLLSRLQLSDEAFADLADLAAKCGIDFLATPFSPRDLAFLLELGVKAIKLASPDIVNGPLLDAAAASVRPVIASTGAADPAEIAAAVQRFHHPGAGPLALLHCVSSYPARESEANLAAIGMLARSFNCVAGFSDHTESVVMGGYAVVAGARIIEKHMTLDRRRTGPDHRFSLEPHAMAEYVRGIREAQRFMGDGMIGTTESQREIRELSRCSLVAARDLLPGEMLSADLLVAKRPGFGISPMQMEALIGRRVLRPIPADTPITWEALAPAVDG